MIKLKKLLLESEYSMNPWFKSSDPYNITMDDIENKLKSKYLPFDQKNHNEVIYDWYYSDDPDKKKTIMDYIEFLNSVLNHIYSLLPPLKIPFIDFNAVKQGILNHTEFYEKIDDFFPFSIYISSSKEDTATIGIELDKSGKILGISEGNDEATPETIQFVNKLVNPSGKVVRIYSSRPREIVYKIQDSGYIPPNNYVSPSIDHAKSYLMIDGSRELFTGIVNTNSINQESDLDWKTIELTKIDKFRIM